MKIPKEVIKEFVREEKFASTSDVLESLKGIFKEVLEEVLQCELEEKLGCERHERRDSDEPTNYRNGTTKRKMKTQIGEVEIAVPRDRNGEYKPQIIEISKKCRWPGRKNIISLCSWNVNQGYTGTD